MLRLQTRDGKFSKCQCQVKAIQVETSFRNAMKCILGNQNVFVFGKNTYTPQEHCTAILLCVKEKKQENER